jgi:hypothetical protein
MNAMTMLFLVSLALAAILQIAALRMAQRE